MSLNRFDFELKSCWKPWLECVKQTLLAGGVTFFSEWDRLCVRACDFKMHAWIALNIFALHLVRPCTSNSIRNTIYKMCVFLPGSDRFSAIYTSQVSIPDSYLSFAFSHILFYSFVVLLQVLFSFVSPHSSAFLLHFFCRRRRYAGITSLPALWPKSCYCRPAATVAS